MGMVRQGAASAVTGSDSTAFGTFYDQTSRLAYGLALRITGDAEQSSAACESAYLQLWEESEGLASATLEQEAKLLEQVRMHAIRSCRERMIEPVRSAEPLRTYELATTLRQQLERVEPMAARAIELAYYGGLNVTEIAEMLGQPVAALRATMRGALLQLGATIPAGQETGR